MHAGGRIKRRCGGRPGLAPPCPALPSCAPRQAPCPLPAARCPLPGHTTPHHTAAPPACSRRHQPRHPTSHSRPPACLAAPRPTLPSRLCHLSCPSHREASAPRRHRCATPCAPARSTYRQPPTPGPAALLTCTTQAGRLIRHLQPGAASSHKPKQPCPDPVPAAAHLLVHTAPAPRIRQYQHSPARPPDRAGQHTTLAPCLLRHLHCAALSPPCRMCSPRSTRVPQGAAAAAPRPRARRISTSPTSR